MTDMKKVIKGLETCSDVYYGADGACSNCPYSQTNGDRCLAELVHDTIDLLKEQEAKLLTIEEITGDGECWFEGINGACGYADCYMCTGSKEVEVHRISMKPEYVSWNDFKKKWRCWSYRPTDEQRKAVKWDD